MQEYKHTDVFYVKVRPSTNFHEKSIDHSEIAQSTELHSEKESGYEADFPLSLLNSEEADHLILYESDAYRLFGLYFYRINIEYAGVSITDCLLLERDALCENFFELYTKDLLMSQLQDHFVTYHEAESKISRH